VSWAGQSLNLRRIIVRKFEERLFDGRSIRQGKDGIKAENRFVMLPDFGTGCPTRVFLSVASQVISILKVAALR
jgi:hypothetical protein